MLGVLPGVRPVNDLVSVVPSLEEDENAMLMLENAQNSVMQRWIRRMKSYQEAVEVEVLSHKLGRCLFCQYPTWMLTLVMFRGFMTAVQGT